MASRIRRGYRAITAVVREQDLAEAQRIADILKTEGLSRADRSLVIRSALVFLSDAVRDKAPNEVLRLFLERRAPRPSRASAPSALSGVKG